MRSGLVVAAALVFAAPAASASPPRFSFGAASATPGDQMVVHAAGARRETRLYLVARADAPKVRSRLDARLSFIGALSGPNLQFTVPPLDSGSYVLAYWCRGCLARGKHIGVRVSSLLRVDAPSATSTCPVTKPNGYAPPRGVPSSPALHGNGVLWASFPADGVFVKTAAEPLFVKMLWIKKGWGGDLSVRYQRIDVAATPIKAETIFGSLSGYVGPTWAASCTSIQAAGRSAAECVT